MNCKYCGSPSETPYCSKACHAAVYAFDASLRAERNSGRVVSFDEHKHGGIDMQSDPSPRKDKERITAHSALLQLARVDPRLPGVLLLIADGETHEDVAERLGISRARVSQFAKLATRITLQSN